MIVSTYAQPTIPKEKIPSNIPADTKKLLEQLYSEEIDEREEAIRALGEAHVREVLPFLLSILNDGPHYCTRRSAILQGTAWVDTTSELCAQAILKIADEQTFELLLGMLKDKDEGARCNAAKLLGEIGDARAIDLLLNALQDENSWVRESVVEALGKIKDPRVTDILIPVLKDGKDSYVFENAAIALVKTGDPRATDVLLDLLKQSDCARQDAAAGALGQIKEPRVVDALIAALNDKNSISAEHVWFALKEITKKDFGLDQKKWQEWWNANRVTVQH